RRADFWPLALMSALIVSICFGLIFWGEQFVSASVTAIVVQGMIPVFLPFFAALHGQKRLTRTRKLSIGLGIAGIACIFSPGLTSAGQSGVTLEIAGLAAIVAGTLAYCYGSVQGRPLLGRNSAV